MNKVLYINKETRTYRVPLYARLNSLLKKRGMDFVLFTSNDKTGYFERQFLDRLISVKYSKSSFSLGLEEKFGSNPIKLDVNFQLLTYIFNIKPRVIIQEGFAGWGIFSWIAKWLLGTKVIISYERTFFTERNNSFLKRVYHVLAVRYLADRFCINGFRTQEYLIGLGVDPQKIHMGSMSSWVVSPRRGGVARSLWDNLGLRGDGTFRFIFCGTLTRRKGVTYLAEIVSLINEKLDKERDIEFLVAGDGPERGLLEALRLNDNFRMHLLGAVSAPEVSHLYSTCDALLLPTLEDNWSLVVPEAMAMGCVPCTSFFNGVVPDLVNSGTGLIIDPFDAEKSALQLVELIEKKEHREQLSVKAAGHVRSRNSLRAASVFEAAVCELL